MLDVARSFAELGQRGYVIPRPHPQLVTRRVLVMERLEGFKFDDVVGMTDAGVDTEAVVRTGMGGVMEGARSEEHTSELQSLMRISYAVFCLKKQKKIADDRTY